VKYGKIGTVICRSFLERKISNSTGQAETYAMQALAKEIVWARLLATELRQNVSLPIKVFADNKGVVKQSTKAINHSTAKHYRVAQAYIRSLAQEGILEVGTVHTSVNGADFLTKANPRDVFSRHCRTVMGPQEPPK
jgi:hypothetical protein